MSGMAFTDDSVIFGHAGLQRWLKENNTIDPPLALQDGRYAAVIHDKHGLSAFTDTMGQDTIFYYSKGDVWGFSNSFLALAESLSESGVRLKINHAVLAAFQIGSRSLFGGQLYSHDTPIRDIYVLPINRLIRVRSQEEKEARLYVKSRPMQSQSTLNYQESLIDFVTTWRRRFFSLGKAGLQGANIGLSGGFDSRITFAIAYPVLADIMKINVHSSPGKLDDLGPANVIREIYNIPERDNFKNPATIDSNEAFNLWKLGNVGCYSPIYMPRRHSASTVINVHGGHFRAVSYARSKPKERIRMSARHIKNNSGVREEFRNLYENSFNEIDVDVDDPKAMQEHYLNFRARFHYGRAWYKNLSSIVVTPLLTRSLKNLTDAREYSVDDVMGQLSHDLMFLLNPDLTDVPFDSKEKFFTHQMRESCPFHRSALPRIIYDSEMKVYGDFTDHSSFGRKGISGENLKSEFRDRIASEMESAVSILSEMALIDDRDINDAILENTKEGRVSKPTAPATSFIISAGAILSLVDD